MAMKAAFAWSLVVLLAGSFIALAGLESEAASAGVGDKRYAKEGCTCHGPPVVGGAPSSGTSVPVSVADASGNATTVVEPGVAYAVTLQVVNAQVQSVPNAENQAGFALRATRGTFASPDANAQPKDSGTWITHTADGAGRSTWFLTWTAPGPGNVTFHFAGNRVNGNLLNDNFDQWNVGTLELDVAAPANDTGPANETAEEAGDDDTPGFGAAAFMGAVAAVVLLRLRRRRRA